MPNTKIQRLIENAKRHFTINDDQQIADFRARQHFLPSALPGSRGATSPLGGLARPAEQLKPSKRTEPRKDWW
jgi:hypothetical protein